MWLDLQYEATRSFLQGEGIFKLTLYTQALSFLLHIGWCYLFVIYLEGGVVGAAVATNVTYTFNLVFVWTYVSLSGICGESWMLKNFTTKLR